MRQLGALDAVFLSMETPSTPGHIGGLVTLDPSTVPDTSESEAPTEALSPTSPDPVGASGLDFDRFRGFVAERIALCPRFGWRVQEVPLGLDLPYWVEDESFRIEDQVHRIGVASPGGARELAALTSLLYAKPLDRDRPLWEMFFIEGLQGGRKAVLWKLHHCLMDGVSGAGLGELLFDISPEPAERPLGPTMADEAPPGEPASWFEMAQQGVLNAAWRPLSLGRHVAQGLRSLRPESLSKTVPRVGFNGKVGPRRGVAWNSLSLAEVKAVKDHFGVTVNDVVLAITGGAVRRYLDEHNDLPKLPLHVIVPVSTRAAGEDQIGNQVSEMSLPWGTNIADPVERLLTIHDEATRAKQLSRASGSNLMAAMGESVFPGLLGLATRAAAAAPDLVPLPGNAVVSNVRGVPIPLYMSGARIEAMTPISVLAPGQGLNLTAVSYGDTLHFGITVDPDLVPEPWILADAIPKALMELQASF